MFKRNRGVTHIGGAIPDPPYRIPAPPPIRKKAYIVAVIENCPEETRRTIQENLGKWIENGGALVVPSGIMRLVLYKNVYELGEAIDLLTGEKIGGHDND